VLYDENYYSGMLWLIYCRSYGIDNYRNSV